MKKERISISGKTLFGKPHIKGTRITVEQVLACLSQGWTISKIVKEFDITKEDIEACVAFAQQCVSRSHFVNVTANA